MSETSIPQVAQVAAELRAIADALNTLNSTPLEHLHVTLHIQPHSRSSDERSIATIDAIGQAVLGKPGAVQVMSNGRHHHDVSGVRGPVSFASYTAITSPAEREHLAEVARLKAEIDELKAQRAEVAS